MLAGSFSSRLWPHSEGSDLYGAGVVGLLDAATRFRPTLGVPFGAYARLRIAGAMLDSRRGPRRLVTGPDLSYLYLPCLALNPEELAIRSQLAAIIHGAVAALPKMGRSAVRLYYSGRVGSEVGELLGVGKARVSQILHEAHLLLALELRLRGFRFLDLLWFARAAPW
jgi:RNA polymerase sigma factor (sigma-70 family)